MIQVRTYPLVDPAAVAAKVKAAGGPAINPAQTSGTASADGVTIGWTTPEDHILITIVSKPWIASYGMIWSHIDAILGCATN
jgi:hypothetical protein